MDNSVFVPYNVCQPYSAPLTPGDCVATMEGINLFGDRTMPEKREGQDLIRVFVPTELKERFKLWCQLQGTTMTEVIEGWIQESLENEDFAKLVQKRLKGSK